MKDILYIGEKDKEIFFKNLISSSLGTRKFNFKTLRSKKVSSKDLEECDCIFYNYEKKVDFDLIKKINQNYLFKLLSNSFLNKIIFSSKLNTKFFLKKNSYYVIPYIKIESKSDLKKAFSEIHQPSFLKSEKDSFKINSFQDLTSSFDKIKNISDCFLEESIETKHLSVLVYFNKDKKVLFEKLDKKVISAAEKIFLKEELTKMFILFKIKSHAIFDVRISNENKIIIENILV